MRPVQFVRVSVAVLLAFLLYQLLQYAPWLASSYIAWTAILLALLGVAALVRPIRWAGIPTRRRALALIAGAVVVAVAALAWPTSLERSPTDGRRLDGFMPEYQFREYHEARTHAPAARVEKAMREVSFADLPVVTLLMRLRAAGGGDLNAPPAPRRPILDLMATPGSGFLPLDTAEPRELVYGMTGQPWRRAPRPPVTTPQQFLAFDAPGNIRVAFDLRIVEGPDGTVTVSTETRARGNDADARRIFARYWRVVYPGSAIIRRVWIDAIVAKAERG